MTSATSTSWWVIGITIAFLVITVLGCVYFVLSRSGSPSAILQQNIASSNGSVLAGAILFACVIAIIMIFVAYFNGMFNKFKTTSDRLTLKYDYLAHYEPVKLIQGLTPGTADNTSRQEFDNIVFTYKSYFMNAVKDLLANRRRVETAVSNVRMAQDPKSLSDYDFSTNAVKLADFMVKNEQIIQANQETAARIMVNSLTEISEDSAVFSFDVYEGRRQVEKVHVLTIIGLYVIFVQKYPTLAKQCIANNRCPFTSGI